MQLVEALEQRDDVALTTEILHANWEGIALQTFKFAVDLLFRLPKIVKEQSIDVVLFSSMVTAALAPLIRTKVDVPLVAINHGRDVTLPVGPYQKYIKSVFKALDATISVSNATRHECVARGMDPYRAFVLPNGLPIGSTATPPDKAKARDLVNKRFEIPTDGKFVVTVGRQVKRKGHQWFLESVLPLLDGINRIVLVGDGPENEAIQSAMHRYEGLSTIHLLGRIDDLDLNRVYDAADVFVMPNIPVPGDMEGFGIVMIEANVHGVPVVASDLEGIKDVIMNGVNGYLVTPLDASGFASKINGIGTADDLFQPQSVSDYVVRTFGWEAIAEKYVRTFESVVKHRSGMGAQI
jgi:phosphatidylinositol alpha-1,6-mannosyltransferase